MKFFGNGVVWDKENRKELCRFSKPIELRGLGVLETDDEALIIKLTGLGYQSDGTVIAVSEIQNSLKLENEGAEKNPYLEMKVTQLREIGKSLGLVFPFGMTKEDMVAQISEKNSQKDE